MPINQSIIALMKYDKTHIMTKYVLISDTNPKCWLLLLSFRDVSSVYPYMFYAQCSLISRLHGTATQYDRLLASSRRLSVCR